MKEKSAAGSSRNAAMACDIPGGDPAGAPPVATAGVATQAAARKAEPAIDLVLEEVRAHDPVGGHAALRVSGQPESLYVLFADLLDDEVDDVVQVLVIGVTPHPGRRVRGGDDQPVLVLVIHDWEIVTLPVSIRAGAVKTKDEGDFLALLQIARIVEEVGAPRLHLDHVSFIDHGGP